MCSANNMYYHYDDPFAHSSRCGHSSVWLRESHVGSPMFTTIRCGCGEAATAMGAAVLLYPP